MQDKPVIFAFHAYPVLNIIDRLPQTGDQGITLQQQLKDTRIEHKQYIDKHGQDLLRIGTWRWKG